MFDFFDFDFTFDFFFGRGRRPEREPERGQDVGVRTGQVRGLPAFPAPVPTFPTSIPAPPPQPFPSGPAANDPIFRRTLGSRIPTAGLGRLLGLGGLVITAAEVLVKVLEGLQADRIADILREQDATTARINIDAILRRLALEKALEIEKKVRALEQAPETFEQPIGDPLPAPAPRTAPVAIPGRISPTTVPFPVVLPSPISVPGPIAPTLPAPAPTPVPAPVGVPTPRTLPVGLPFELPVFFPRFTPVADPITTPIGDPLLTPFEGTPVPSPAPGPTSQFAFAPDPRLAPQAQQDPDERCRRKCRDDEIRTQCFKGLYRETTRSTEFTEWTEIDCITGQEIATPSVLRDVSSNIVELF